MSVGLKSEKDLMASALDLLIRGGRARPYPDGTVEAIVEAAKVTPPSP
jgi:AcrR family transcriptional regulator